MATLTFSLLNTLPSSQNSLSSSSFKPLTFNVAGDFRTRRKTLTFTTVKSCLNLPLKAESPAGKSLSSALQNDPKSFYDVVEAQLYWIARGRDDAVARFHLSIGSHESELHRRIAGLKEAECQRAVEDVLYMIIVYKFSEIRVPLIPSLSKCLYEDRLEILPSKDWELESIHSDEVLEMVRDHLSIVLGWEAGSSVAVNWSTTKVQRVHLRRTYAASMYFGYLLKSASLRFHLEHSVPQTYEATPFDSWAPSSECGLFGVENMILGQIVSPRSTTLSQVLASTIPGKKEAKLRRYLLSFDRQTRCLCAKLRSEEAVHLVRKHWSALFEIDEAHTAEDDKMILTSLSSLKRLVLEAVAFGCFLWEAEQCVNKTYKLKDR